MTSIDTATAAAVGLLWFIGFAALYAWTALALAAVFRKSGEEGWKAWVPILNQVVLFRLGGVSPLFLLLYLVVGPGALAVWVFQIIACHRVNAEFALGGGMTVVAALVFPVWASIVGFGSARWVGGAAGPRRVGSVYATDPPALPSGLPLPPLPPVPGADPAFRARSTHVAPSDPALTASTETVAPPAPAPGRPMPFAPTAPAPVQGDAPIAPRTARSQSPVPPPAGGWAPPPLPDGPAPPPPSPAAPVAPVTSVPSASAPTNPVTPVPAESEASPFAPAHSTPIVDWSSDADTARPERGRATFTGPTELPPVSEDTGEVTGTVEGAFAPLSALSPSPSPAPAPAAEPPVTRGRAPQPEPWAPARSPIPETEAFPDTSGPVSAIVGAPDAGAPRSARSSVSAQNRRPQIPEDPLEETIIARRRRTEWSLIPPGGDPIAIGSDVVLLGRRPAQDPAHPGAQLISIDEGTVSKTHARLALRGDKWYVTDLDSTNGVVFATLMGTEVEATPGVEIEAGDRFLLGDAEIRLVRGAE